MLRVRRRSRAAPAGRRGRSRRRARSASRDRRTAARPRRRRSRASLIPRSARRNASASAVEKPPTSGVPVPGAKAGSRKSMSNETKTGRAPTLPEHELAVGGRPEVAQLVGGEHGEAEVARSLRGPPPRTAIRASPPAPTRVVSSRPSSRRALERRAVEVRLAEVLLPRVAVRVELDERERAVALRERRSSASVIEWSPPIAADERRRPRRRVRAPPRSGRTSSRCRRARRARRRSRRSRATSTTFTSSAGLYGRISDEAERIASGRTATRCGSSSRCRTGCRRRSRRLRRGR